MLNVRRFRVKHETRQIEKLCFEWCRRARVCGREKLVFLLKIKNRSRINIYRVRLFYIKTVLDCLKRKKKSSFFFCT